MKKRILSLTLVTALTLTPAVLAAETAPETGERKNVQSAQADQTPETQSVLTTASN